MALVQIPSLMRDLTGGAIVVQAPGKTVGEVLDVLELQYPGVKARLCEGGQLSPLLSVAVDGKVTSLRLKARVRDDSEIQFVPALAGG